MEYKRYGDTCAVRLDPGDELIACLTALCEQEQIDTAEINGLGAADHAVIGLYDIPTRTFLKQELAYPMEVATITGNATRMNGHVYLHIHGVVCDRDLVSRGGHIASLTISATAELFVRILPAQIGRRHDDEVTGLNLMQF